jgi:hypothetical protein
MTNFNNKDGDFIWTNTLRRRKVYLTSEMEIGGKFREIVEMQHPKVKIAESKTSIIWNLYSR